MLRKPRDPEGARGAEVAAVHALTRRPSSQSHGRGRPLHTGTVPPGHILASQVVLRSLSGGGPSPQEAGDPRVQLAPTWTRPPALRFPGTAHYPNPPGEHKGKEARIHGYDTPCGPPTSEG